MNLRELMVLLLVCTIWGMHIIVIKVGVSEIPPMFYAALRMSLVAALLSPFLRWRPGQMARIFFAGICLGGLNYIFMFTGLNHATASASALALELYVPFATILSVIFLKERVGIKRIAGITLAFSGVALIALSKGELDLTFGITLMAMAAFFDATGAVILKKTEGFKPLQMLAWFSLIGMAALWIATFTFEDQQVEKLQEGNTKLIISAILYSAIGGSIIGHSCYYWLLQRLPLSLLAPNVLFTTFLSVIFAVILLGEKLTPQIIFGGIMIMVGVGIILVRTNRNPTIEPNQEALS